MDKEIIVNGVDISGCIHYNPLGNYSCSGNKKCPQWSNCYYKQLKRKIQKYEELKIENEELSNRMAEVTYRATGGRLSYSNYTLDAIEQAFNDQLEILSDRKVEKETTELNQKLYLVQNEVHFKTEYIQEQREEIKQLEQKNEEPKRKVEDYKKALDEIEKNIKAMNNECFYDDICDCNNCDMKNGCSYYRKFKTLDIITKIKENI